MNISKKLQTLRKNQGLSQEEFAELLSVSRQAVGKWENGKAVPELNKLVLLSDLFKIPIDRLIRDDEECNLALIKNEIYVDDKVQMFLIRAKKATYAGHGAEVSSSRKKSHDLEYREGNMYYYDTYLGGERFSGEEAVWIDDNAIWCMNYTGRVIGEGFSGDFLKNALLQVPKDKPFRGPMIFKEGAYCYHCKVDGDFSWYQGYEDIFFEQRKVYECYFHGGIVV